MESDAEEEAAATPAAGAAPDAGVLKGIPELSVDADMREMAKTAAWSVSSCKAGNGVAALRDDNLDTYWQSDGAQPHLVNIQFQNKVQLQLVVLYVYFKLDESYTPSKILIRAGYGFHNLKEIKAVELAKPVGWVHISLSGADLRQLHNHLSWHVCAKKHSFIHLCSKLRFCPITLMEGILISDRSRYMVHARTLFLTNRFILLPKSSSHARLLGDRLTVGHTPLPAQD